MRESFDDILELCEADVRLSYEIFFLLGLTIEETLLSLADIAKRNFGGRPHIIR
jgi:hypothetical protein